MIMVIIRPYSQGQIVGFHISEPWMDLTGERTDNRNKADNISNGMDH